MTTLSSAPKGEITSISGISFDLPLEERISKLRDIKSFGPVSLKQLGQFFGANIAPVAIGRLITKNLQVIRDYAEAESIQRILTFTQSGIRKLLQIPELVPQESCSEVLGGVGGVTQYIPPKINQALLSTTQMNGIAISEWLTSIELKMNISINRSKRNKFMMQLRNDYVSYLILGDRNTYIRNEYLEEVEKLLLTFLESIREVTLV